MTFIGKTIKRAIHLQTTIKKVRRKIDGPTLQEKTLVKLLKKARNTKFGRFYQFNKILKSADIPNEFRKHVPIFDYNTIYKEWWFKTLDAESNVCWPGKIRYFALSSGTSEASSKHIPVTADMIKSIRKTSIRHILTLSQYDLPETFFEKGILMIGGSTHLNKKGSYFEGDLSGINAGKIPFWFQHFYKPGKKIAKEKDWHNKIKQIVQKAKDWDIGIVAGVPAWVQIIIEKIIEHYNLKTIHDIWPNFTIYVHGGVAFEPYKKGFEKLLDKPLMYLDTYLASEGFIAYQAHKDAKGMELVLNNGIFVEFVPFNEQNFDAEGQIRPTAQSLLLKEVELNKEYAILLTTNAGAWRYLIGDTVKFVSLEPYEIVITGRTKHFLSLCGEHLSVDNMNNAVKRLADEFNLVIKEFTVSGIEYQNLFAHKWYLSVDDKNVDKEKLKSRLDEILKEINDDYAVERSAALKEIIVETVPTEMFYKWLDSKGKQGGQTKFPRVLKNDLFADFESFVSKANNNTTEK